MQRHHQSNQECLRHYTWLKANAGNDILFQLTPKFHWAYHLGYMCQWQNPKTYWTFGQESWVGSMSTLARMEPRQPICLVASVRSVCWVSSSGSTITLEACEKAKHYVTVASQASLLHALKQWAKMFTAKKVSACGPFADCLKLIFVYIYIYIYD